MTTLALRLTLLAVATATILGGCGDGDSGPRIGEIIRITPEGANYGVVATRNGHAVVAATPSIGPASITLRSRTAPGVWTDPEPVAEPGFQVMSLTPGVDDSGRPTVAWVARNLGTTASQISTRNVDGTWPTPISIPPVARSPFSTFDLGVTGRGDVIAVWDPSAGLPGEAIIGAVRSPEGSWENTRVLERTTAQRLQTGAIVAPHRDSATVVWTQTTAVRMLRSLVRAAHWDAKDGWGPTRTLPTTGLVDAKPLPAGRTLLAWTALRGGAQRLDVAVLEPGGSLTPLGTIPTGKDQSPNPRRLATAPDGSAAVLVPRWTGGQAPAELVLVRIGADGTLGTPLVLDRQPVPPAIDELEQRRTPRFWGADLALDEDGTVTAAWLESPPAARPGEPTATLAIATVTPDGRVESSETVTDTDGSGVNRARVDRLGPGLTLVSWGRADRSGSITGTYGVEVAR